MKSFRERRAWLVGLVSIALIAAGLFAAFSINRFDSLRGVYTVSADLKDAAGLQPGNEVRVAGVKVGRVTAITLRPDAARVEMEIAQDVEIPVETILEVKLKTLLGQKFIDLQIPRSILTAASGGGDTSAVSAGILQDGDVIPRSQTRVPFEIYQAATEGTAVLKGIDKRSLRKMITVLSETVGASKDELARALTSLDRAGTVLSDKSPQITALLRSTKDATDALAAGGEDLSGTLKRAAEVLEVLADRRATTSSLLAATNDLAGNLALLIRAARGSVSSGVTDLNSILIAAQDELDSIEVALDELGTSQRMFGTPLTFGRFTEGHVCAVTSEDTCVPQGSPENPGLPVHNVQPPPSSKAGLR
jgi:phospholipid/cholesterol/gamma-HCH transport system substrate-binding protein